MNVPWILMSRGAVTLHKQEHDKKNPGLREWVCGMNVLTLILLAKKSWSNKTCSQQNLNRLQILQIPFVCCYRTAVHEKCLSEHVKLQFWMTEWETALVRQLFFVLLPKRHRLLTCGSAENHSFNISSLSCALAAITPTYTNALSKHIGSLYVCADGSKCSGLLETDEVSAFSSHNHIILL